MRFLLIPRCYLALSKFIIEIWNIIFLINQRNKRRLLLFLQNWGPVCFRKPRMLFDLIDPIDSESFLGIFIEKSLKKGLEPGWCSGRKYWFLSFYFNKRVFIIGWEESRVANNHLINNIPKAPIIYCFAVRKFLNNFWR